MKENKIQISINFRCNKCHPEIKTDKEYKSGWMKNVYIITDGKKEYSDKVVCDQCGKWIGNYNVYKIKE